MSDSAGDAIPSMVLIAGVFLIALGEQFLRYFQGRLMILGFLLLALAALLFARWVLKQD